jgi:3''-deamino-3''-oxonicotianamine reductase
MLLLATCGNPWDKYIYIYIVFRKLQVCIRWAYEMGDCVITKSFNEMRMRGNLDIFNWELPDEDRDKIDDLPESRGNYSFFVHESGPYKTVDEFWDGEIIAGECKEIAFVSST